MVPQIKFQILNAAGFALEIYVFV